MACDRSSHQHQLALELRQQLLAQREQIARQLQPASQAINGYPRSKTMRFLIRWRALPTGVAVGAARLLTGGRLAASLVTAITLGQAVRRRRSARHH